MKTNVSFYDFRQKFEDYDRSEQFTGEGLSALFDALEELEDGMGEEMTLDVIALCCGYQEYSDIAEYNESYGTDFTDIDEVDEVFCAVGDSGFICWEH